VAQGATRTEADRYARVSRGRPGVALSFLQDPALFDDFIKNLRERDRLLGEPIYSRLRWTEGNAKKLKTDTLAEEFRLWREALRDRLLSALRVPEFAVEDRKKNAALPQETPVLVAQLKKLAEAEIAARHHVDPRAAIEHFLLASDR
ncbi:MAG: hypothetical protein Q8P82_01210, partial [bacterium]|nr:hypothetical protein [bacterium]